MLTENKADGKPKLSDDDIYATSITFLLAGYETTSNALAFTTYLLALNPDVQDRLFKEIKANIPDSEVLLQYVLILTRMGVVISRLVSTL